MTVTVLRCPWPHRATKLARRHPDGQVEILGYDAGWRFAVEEHDANGLADLAEVLARVVAEPRAFVIRAEPLPGTDRRRARRLLHPHREDDGTVARPTFREVPRTWAILDFDSVPAPDGLDPLDGAAVAAHCRRLLPPAWRTASCWWALSASAGFKPGIRIKLAFWLGRPSLGAEIARHLAGCPIDPCTLRAVQPIYLAAPILTGGIADPAPARCGLAVAADDAVELPELPPPAPVEVHTTHDAAGRRYVSGGTPDTAQRRLAALCGAVERAAVGQRRLCLLWAAVRAVELDDALPRTAIAAELIAAARRAGLDESEGELVRQVRDGFRIGIFGTGGAV